VTTEDVRLLEDDEPWQHCWTRMCWSYWSLPAMRIMMRQKHGSPTRTTQQHKDVTELLPTIPQQPG